MRIADVIVVGHGGRAHSLKAKIVAKREFAGYWEYVLDEALFTAPAHPQWGGAALVGHDGRLLGIGSLLVQESIGGKAVDGNMFVPIDLLAPILGDLLAVGVRGRHARMAGHLHRRNGWPPCHRGPCAGRPAERAGVMLGDLILEVGGEPVTGLAGDVPPHMEHGPCRQRHSADAVAPRRLLKVQIRSGRPQRLPEKAAPALMVDGGKMRFAPI
jgi:S1-C subfamily serine protease